MRRALPCAQDVQHGAANAFVVADEKGVSVLRLLFGRAFAHDLHPDLKQLLGERSIRRQTPRHLSDG